MTSKRRRQSVPDVPERRRFGSIRQLPSGRFQARYTGPDTTVYKAPRTFQSRDDAGAWLRAEEKLVEFSEWTPPTTRRTMSTEKIRTVGDYFDTWLVQRDLRPSTRDTYRRVWDARVKPYLGGKPLATTTPAVVRAWWAEVTTDHDTATRNAHAYQVLRAVMNTAVEDGLIPVNPCQIRAAGRSPKRADFTLLTVEELGRITAEMPAWYAASVPVMAWCGLRYGEVTELRRKDVTADAKTIRIRRGVTYVGGEFIVGPPKTADGVRDVAVPPNVVPVLKDHLDRHVGRDPEALIFTTKDGNRLLHSTYRDTFQAALKRAGIDRPVKVHHLRHLGAVLAARAGATTKELMARLGHTTPAAAMIYQHAAAGRDEEIARKMAELAGQ
ncbi:hypothetical protein AYJ66_06450 [Dietzia cinnamea]|nr:hypothetical protein AYJ66_06450 [Dietzia cinnamea]